MIIETQAIVLSAIKYGDSSRIVRLYTRDSGKTSVMAKGARSSKNKYGSALQPLSYINISYYKKSHSDLHLLGNTETAIPLRRIQESIDHMTAGLMMLESISQTAQENEANSKLFDILVIALVLLNENKPNPFSVFIAFQLHLIRELGFSIDFGIDLFVQGKSEVYFSLDTGILVQSMMGYDKTSIRFNKEEFQLLVRLAENDIEKSIEVEMTTQQLNNIIEFFIRYFGYHLEKKFSFRSYQVLGNL